MLPHNCAVLRASSSLGLVFFAAHSASLYLGLIFTWNKTNPDNLFRLAKMNPTNLFRLAKISWTLSQTLFVLRDG